MKRMHISWYDLSTYMSLSKKGFSDVIYDQATNKLARIISENDEYNLKRVLDYAIGHLEDVECATFKGVKKDE